MWRDQCKRTVIIDPKTSAAAGRNPDRPLLPYSLIPSLPSSRKIRLRQDSVEPCDLAAERVQRGGIEVGRIADGERSVEAQDLFAGCRQRAAAADAGQQPDLFLEPLQLEQHRARVERIERQEVNDSAPAGLH